MNDRIRKIVVFCFLMMTGPALAWDNARLSVAVTVNGHEIPYPVFAVFVMPNRPLAVALTNGQSNASVSFRGNTRDLSRARFEAPASPRLDVLEIRNDATGELATINVFTMASANKVNRDARLNGYRIGRYPDEPLRGLDIYLPPRGFVEVTAENRDTRVSPNFTLGEFVAKQASGYPKYLVLRSSLLLKLENILASLNGAGYPTGKLVIMSGYRTPFYNRAIGNVAYSRHVWGGAADFYIDEAPADGRMDDLNGDGAINRADSRWLADFIGEMSRKGAFGPRIGGLGVYGSNSAHGPFVHVDVRGTRARW